MPAGVVPSCKRVIEVWYTYPLDGYGPKNCALMNMFLVTSTYIYMNHLRKSRVSWSKHVNQLSTDTNETEEIKDSEACLCVTAVFVCSKQPHVTADIMTR